MDVLKAFGQTLFKMFAADLPLTATALVVVAVAALALKLSLAPPGAVPYLMAAGVLAALAIGVARGARKP